MKKSTIILIIIAVAIVFGGVGYYLAKKVATSSTSATATVTATASASATKTTQSKTTTPAIAFDPPGLFSEQEKSDITSKILDPYIYYQNDAQPGELVSILVTKYAENERPAEYYFAANAIFKNGGTENWLFSNDGSIDYWKPVCMDECNLSATFKSKFPNNVPE